MTSRELTILTNSFAITELPSKRYYQYDIVFVPEVKEKSKRNRMFHSLQLSVAPLVFFPRIVYDGNAIGYCPERLNFNGNNAGTFMIMLGKNEQPPVGTRGATQIKVSLTSSPPIDPKDLEDTTHRGKITQRSIVATNLMQLIVRQWPNMNHTNNGKAYFTPNGKQVIREAGIELWSGVFQSVRPTFQRMILTIDTSTAAVYRDGPLLNIIMEYLQLRNPRELELQENHPNFRKLEKFVKKLRIKVKTGMGGEKSRIKTIRGLVPAGGQYLFYKEDEGKEMSVAQYFQEAYNIKIGYPRIVGVSLSGPKGSGKQDVVPLELCEVEQGQLYKQKIPENVTSHMVRYSTMTPEQRLSKIMQSIPRYSESPFVREAGMRIDAERPMHVKAKVLITPQVMYGQGGRADVRNGGWNVVRKTFFEAVGMVSWAMVNFVAERVDQGSCNRMVTELMNSCQSLGMNVARPHGVYPARGQNVTADLEKVMEHVVNSGIDNRVIPKTVLMIILPQNAAAIRSAVKSWGDITRGIVTMCIREGKVASANNQYFNNIALKLNARLGGRNSIGISPAMTELKREPFIIMGADVGHAGPGTQKPSVSSLVYSHDDQATQYAAIIGLQEPRTEIIADLRAYVKEAVDNWGSKNKIAPQRIFFFRDGVSEGEFARVAEEEITAIKAAVDELWKEKAAKEPKPKLTFIIVGKRHHAVFFPAQKQDGDAKTGNIPAGSVIDGPNITHPATEDFYLQSHAAVKGTCRSSHYSVLLNENKQFDIAKIQELANTLCYVYAKATRSVSIPAPVYYADLVCARGMFHMDPSLSMSLDDGMSVSSGQTSIDLDSWKAAFLKTNPRQGKAMYFL